MRALWSDRPKCSHNVTQKVKRISCLSESWGLKNRDFAGWGGIAATAESRAIMAHSAMDLVLLI